ncbi:hypothetical protein GCM10027416_32340 [Okibacterium endophyticum]
MRPLVTAAAVSYAANCALGVSAATGRVDTSRSRWVHHALYVCTAALAGAAMSSGIRNRSRAGYLLMPAAVPLTLIPFAGSRGRRHTVIALAAAPFFVLSLLRAWR